jgi:hypothetical protein
MLWHNHNPKRLDTPTAPAKIGSIAGRHRHGWFLTFQALRHGIRPASAQHSLDLAPIHALVGDQNQCDVVAICHASEAHIAPSLPAPRHPVSNLAQPTPQPSNSVR